MIKNIDGLKAEASSKVQETTELEEYYDLLIDYNWDNYPEHLNWIMETGVWEIVDWCEAVLSSTEIIEDGEKLSYQDAADLLAENSQWSEDGYGNSSLGEQY